MSWLSGGLSEGSPRHTSCGGPWRGLRGRLLPGQEAGSSGTRTPGGLAGNPCISGRGISVSQLSTTLGADPPSWQAGTATPALTRGLCLCGLGL